MGKWFTAVLDLLFPPKCPFCGRVMERSGVCGKCQAELPWTGDEAVKAIPGGLRCAGPLWYEDRVRKALLRLKFQGVSALAEPIGGLIAQCAAEELSGEFDVVTWAPVSEKRLRRRGYDQAELLARAACRVWETKPEKLLRKTVDNPAQSGQESAEARRKNVQGVYAAVGDVAGRRVLLIDDICTTGSTLAACGETLLRAGAASVVCAAAALTREQEKVHKIPEE